MPSASKVVPAPQDEELGREFMRTLDAGLVAALETGAVRLLDCNALREGALSRAQSRQELEAREAAGERLFLTPVEAVDALRANGRTIGFLSYGWRTRRHPDPDGATLYAPTFARKVPPNGRRLFAPGGAKDAAPAEATANGEAAEAGGA